MRQYEYCVREALIIFKRITIGNYNVGRLHMPFAALDVSVL